MFLYMILDDNQTNQVKTCATGEENIPNQALFSIYRKEHSGSPISLRIQA